MRWIIPDNLPSFPRIYAEIDGDDLLTEIHENNNRSWSVMQKTTGEKIIDDLEEYIQEEFVPEQNYPNPFRDMTRIRFTIPVQRFVTIEVYNIYGQKLATLLNRTMPEGYHEVEFNGEYLASGIYICRIKADSQQYMYKMMKY